MTARTRIRTFKFFVATALAGALVASTGVQAQNAGVKETTKSLQRALARLPYYGVFDYLSFSVDRGTVTLLGYAYSGTLKTDAEHAVKRVAGVDEVANRLELLPASLNDDRIRQATFLRIYGDSVLSRYASGGPGAALYDALEFGRIPGRQPFGNYAIHIVVKGGRTTLVGNVDSAMDRQLAEFRAREVTGLFGLNNELTIVR